MPKALGTMNFIKLFKKLLQQNISGAIIRVLLEFCFSQNVSIFGVLFFRPANGVRQRSAASLQFFVGLY